MSKENRGSSKDICKKTRGLAKMSKETVGSNSPKIKKFIFVDPTQGSEMQQGHGKIYILLPLVAMIFAGENEGETRFGSCVKK